jgi:hypothetical protein
MYNDIYAPSTYYEPDEPRNFEEDEEFYEAEQEQLYDAWHNGDFDND